MEIGQSFFFQSSAFSLNDKAIIWSCSPLPILPYQKYLNPRNVRILVSGMSQCITVDGFNSSLFLSSCTYCFYLQNMVMESFPND